MGADPDAPTGGTPEVAAAAPGLTRRALIGGAGALGAGAAVYALTRGVDDSPAGGGVATATGGIVPFHGTHQAGIATPPQDRLLFGAFDVLPGVERAGVTDLLKAWTAASAVITRGRMLGENDEPLAPTDDTGEAQGLSASQLTITFGFGPTFFLADGVDRFGIAAKQPAALTPLPAFPGDALDPATSGGDIAVQVCANDPQVAFHALRNLTRIGKGTVGLRWSQLGFGRTSGTVTGEADRPGTPRNLMGYKDGTNNVDVGDDTAMRNAVWVGTTTTPSWLRNGTFLVSRRIRMHIEVWDRNSLSDQDRTFGRQKSSGAPIGGVREFDAVDLAARDAKGDLEVDEFAHIRLAAPSENDGARLLRRGYSFTDGVDPRTAGLDAGLFFIAYMRDPTQFITVQQRLATHDLLNEYIQHTGSALFAVPGGVGKGEWIGEGIFT